MENDYLVNKALRDIEKSWRDPKVKGQAVWVTAQEGNEQKILAPTKTQIHDKGKSLILRRNKYLVTAVPQAKKKQIVTGISQIKNFKMSGKNALAIDQHYKKYGNKEFKEFSVI